jgi:hypothetical protein
VASTELAWDALEQSVEQLFRAAGYYVERGVEKGGFEFDIIATKEEFANLGMRIAVECKHRANGTVTNTDIHSFENAFHANKDALNLTHAIAVSNHRFSRQAHEAVAWTNVFAYGYLFVEDSARNITRFVRRSAVAVS